MQGDTEIAEMHIVWLTAGLGCDGDTIAMTAATNPSIEDVLSGALPGLPKVHLHNPVLAYEVGCNFVRILERAASGELGPFILVVEGSIPDERNKAEGYWAAIGTDPESGQPITTCEWIDRLAPRAWAAVGAGTCASYGARSCIVKLGCWGPVVQCNVAKRGWINGIGGCPNVGGVCIGCTMPGFPDKFVPFMDEPPGAHMSTAAVNVYGKTVRSLRQFTLASMNREPERSAGHRQP